MKNILLPSLLIIISFSLCFGQISILSSDLPKANDTIRMSVADPASISNFEATGTNYNWDFGSLKPQRQRLNEYKAALKTPYAFYFFGLTKFGVLIAEALNLGVVQLTDVYDFYDKTSSAYLREGMGITFSGIPLPSYFTNKDEVYQFPLEYGDRDSSTFHFTVNLLTLATYSTSGYRINEVDGWGKITTPYGTFDCIRLKTTLIASDTVNVGGSPTGFSNNSVEYKWLAKNQKYPILEIKGMGEGASYVVNEVNYRDVYRYVYDPTAVVADFIASDLLPNTKDTVSFLNQSKNALPLSTFIWSFNPNTIEFVHGTDENTENPDVVFKQPGKYSVKLEVISFTSKHDTTKTDYITARDAAGLNETELMKNRFFIYPNPVSTVLKISITKSIEEETAVKLFDINGKLIHSFSVHDTETEINVTSLAEGIYFVQIIRTDEVLLKMFLKE
ncbi:MAG: T9SS type A sorting domain-containing protein [Bacteroidetes bacterium]|nr:T9SS type A sorting domain-containing protein [Bacteroidota bacterium]MBL6963085.1 T9SS type A sorting domain-containing protein [Bacteroidota bacterium]